MFLNAGEIFVKSHCSSQKKLLTSGFGELDDMASLGDVFGKIKKHRKQIYVEWEIENFFSSVPGAVDTFIYSPYFHSANVTWYLRLDPNGCKKDENVGWIAMYLMLLDEQTKEKFSVDFTLGIKRGDQEEYTASLKYLFGGKGGYGHSLIKRELLYVKKEKLVPGDTLTVFCRASTASQRRDGVCTLSEDFKNMLNNGKDYDATIHVKSRFFHVHKLILGSRSPVLYAMFQHDMKENSSNSVNIVDCDPEIFHDFLLFLYSGKTENLSPDNAVRLYNLADKYISKELKQICSDFMEVNMNLDNIFEIVILADRHNETQLMETAYEWVKNNLKDVVQTDQWYNLMAENTDLAAKLLRKAVPDKKKS